MAIVAIEGLDGCGKTTQAKMLVSKLQEEGYRAVYVRPVFIFSNILTKSRIPFSPRKSHTAEISGVKAYNIFFPMLKLLIGLLGYLYALGTYLFMTIYLRRKGIIVCDRYFYHFFFDLFRSFAEKVITVFPKSDITFFLDGDVDPLYSRMSTPSDKLTSKDYYLSGCLKTFYAGG